MIHTYLVKVGVTRGWARLGKLDELQVACLSQDGILVGVEEGAPWIMWCGYLPWGCRTFHVFNVCGWGWNPSSSFDFPQWPCIKLHALEPHPCSLACPWRGNLRKNPQSKACMTTKVVRSCIDVVAVVNCSMKWQRVSTSPCFTYFKAVEVLGTTLRSMNLALNLLLRVLK